MPKCFEMQTTRTGKARRASERSQSTVGSAFQCYTNHYAALFAESVPTHFAEIKSNPKFSGARRGCSSVYTISAPPLISRVVMQKRHELDEFRLARCDAHAARPSRCALTVCESIKGTTLNKQTVKSKLAVFKHVDVLNASLHFERTSTVSSRLTQ